MTTSSKAVTDASAWLRPIGGSTALVANLLVLGTLGYAALLNEYDPDLYYLSVQEDEYLEWATFWAFLGGAGVSAAGSLWQRQATGKVPWFFFGVSLFCIFVAMEEISWGQRLTGYRPPAYFLEHNFQQELNVHNVVATRYRKLVLGGIIAGYGVFLPLVALLPAVGRVLRRAAVVVPPRALVPSFAATFVVFAGYPWTYSGEWVELMLGLGFLFTALLMAQGFRSGLPSSGEDGGSARIAVSWLVVISLGILTAGAWRMQRGTHPEIVEAAGLEIEALRRDFASGKLLTRCGLHKRLYAYMDKYDQSYLLEGEFSRLTAKGLPEARARFLLDPWNLPYWVRDTCTNDRSRRVSVVYSFGPNRSRDSTAWEIRGDDVAAFIPREGSSAEELSEPTDEPDPDPR